MYSNCWVNDGVLYNVQFEETNYILPSYVYMYVYNIYIYTLTYMYKECVTRDRYRDFS